MSQRRSAPTLVSPPSVDSRAVHVLLAILLISAPLLLGGVFPWAIAIIGIIAALCLASAYKLEQRSPQARYWSALEILWFASILWTALQVIPLPWSWLQTLRPELATVWHLNAEAFGTAPPKFVPLSFDPGSSYLEIVKGLTIFSTLVTMRSYVRHTNARAGVLLIASSVVIMIVVALGHKLSHAQNIFGIYKPVHAYSRLLAPLMNENHLGGLFMFGTPVLIGLAAQERLKSLKIAWFVLAALSAGVCALTLSRGAIGVLCVVLSLLAVLLISRRSSLPTWPRIALLILITIAGLGLVRLSPFGSQLRKEFVQTHNLTTKVEFAKASLPIIEKHPWLGVGRGAYAAAAAREFGTERRAYHPEDILVQWLSEWGVPFSLLFLVGLLAILAQAWREADSILKMSALLGVCALLTHNLIDFSLELLGVAVLFWACIAALSTASSRIIFRPVAILAATLLTGLMSLGVFLFHQRDLYTIDTRFRAALEHNHTQSLGDIASTARLIHPADPLIAVAQALYRVQTQPETAAKALNFALFIAPRWDSSHLVAAEWLLAQNRLVQALFEVRLAEKLRAGSARTLMCRLLTSVKDLETLFLAAPQGSAGAEFLNRISECSQADAELSEALDKKALELDPRSIVPAIRQARRWELRGEPQLALQLLRSLPLTGPNEERVRAALASMLFRNAHVDEARELINPLLAKRTVSAEALQLAMYLAAAQNDYDELENLAARWRTQVGSNPIELTQIELFLSAVYEQSGQMAQALDCAERAIQYTSSRDAIRTALRLAHLTDDLPRMVLLRRRWCIVHPDLNECRTIGLTDATPKN